MSDEELTEELVKRVSTFDIRNTSPYPEPNFGIVHRRAAILLPIAVKNGEVLVLLTKRSKNLRSHPSAVAFPGGMRDETDESDIEAALREAEEEIGLPRSAVEVLGILTLGVTLPTNIVYPVVGIIPNDFEPTCNPSEVEYAFYMPLRTFVDEGNVFYQAVTVRGKKVPFPVLDYTHDGKSEKMYGFTCNFCVLLAKIIFGSKDVDGTISSAKEHVQTLEKYFQFITSTAVAKL